MIVRPLEPDDVPACAEIVRGLPDYFTPDVPDKVGRDAARHGGRVLLDGGRLAGFVVAERRPPGAAEILWMAVEASRRGRGEGTRLLRHVLAELRAESVRLVEVKTLDQAAGYRPYEATRAFWEARGFVRIDAIDPLPGWDPGNPAAIYVAALAPTV